MRLKDANKLIELIDDDIAALDKSMSREGYDVCLCTLQMVKQYIKALPTIDIDAITKAHADKGYEQGYRDGYATAKPVSARWKDAGMGDYMCSRCAEVISGNRHHYCPNCGAPMDLDEVKE